MKKAIIILSLTILCFINMPANKSYAKSIVKNLYLGETISLSDESLNNPKFKLSNKKILTLSKKGIVHAKKEGTSNITVTDNDKKITYKIKVNKRGLIYPYFSMMKGEKLNLLFSKKFSNVKWHSQNKKVATVSKSGTIRAKKVGHTLIIGKNQKHKFYCSLSVTKKKRSIIYLTFDDGPSSSSTPKILNILKKNNVKATFFELKTARKDYNITKRVINEGHTLALHGYQHDYRKIYRSKNIYHNNLDKLRSFFFKRFGVYCTISRFPGGSSNTVSRFNRGIMTKLTKSIHSWNYTYFDWNVGSGDSGDVHTSAGVYKNVISGLKKGRSNVVLMHDFPNNHKTVNALDRIIKYGKRHGYTFKKITASTKEIHHGVNN